MDDKEMQQQKTMFEARTRGNTFGRWINKVLNMEKKETNIEKAAEEIVKK